MTDGEVSPPFAQRARALRSSVIRDILKLTQRPGMISLAGGLPAPETFPLELLRAAFDRVLTAHGRAALQYSTTEGHPPLREWIAARETARGIPTRADQILIVSGSQQALDLIAKALVEPGAPLLVEAPTYLGALQAFSLFAPAWRLVPTDDGGLMPDALTADLTHGAGFLYAMPNFQNPSGRTLTYERRAALAERARRHDFWIVEDDPYGELWYEVAPPPSLRAFASERVIRMGSFSKILAPGLRLGYVIAPEPVIATLARLKQATDLHTATVTQMAAYDVLAGGHLDTLLPLTRSRYARQCAALLDALDQFFTGRAHWTRPAGGMFVWVELAAAVDATALLAQAIKRQVAFVPGAAFYPVGAHANTLRLSFVTVAAEQLQVGVERLARCLDEPAAEAATHAPAVPNSERGGEIGYELRG